MGQKDRTLRRRNVCLQHKFALREKLSLPNYNQFPGIKKKKKKRESEGLAKSLSRWLFMHLEGVGVTAPGSEHVGAAGRSSPSFI